MIVMCSNGMQVLDAATSRMISRRRFCSQFLEWNEFVSKRVVMDDDHHLVVDPTAVKQLQDDLYQRMQLMLPVAAAVMTADPPYKQGEPWSLVHSACLVSCPAAMLHIALKWNLQYHAVRSKDLKAAGGIRYIATRIGYSATYPLASRGIQILQEALLFTTFYPFPRGLSRHRCGKAAAAAHCH
jgi:hypothetical protein